jgi:hypothetical protein
MVEDRVLVTRVAVDVSFGVVEDLRPCRPPEGAASGSETLPVASMKVDSIRQV